MEQPPLARVQRLPRRRRRCFRAFERKIRRAADSGEEGTTIHVARGLDRETDRGLERRALSVAPII